MSYAQIFNSQSMQQGRKLLWFEVEKIVTQALLADASFVQNVYVVVPTVEDVPDECTECTYKWEEKLAEERNVIQLNSNMVGYLVDPTYQVASDLQGYLSCANPAFADWC